MKGISIVLLALVILSLACNLTTKAGNDEPTPFSLNPLPQDNTDAANGVDGDDLSNEDDLTGDRDDDNTDTDSGSQTGNDDDANDNNTGNNSNPNNGGSGNNTGNNTGNSGNSGSNGGNTAPTCIPNSTWPQYSVRSGDTLSQIARRSNTTTDVLVAANCLSNANVISVGQLLRVPQIPVENPIVGRLEVFPGQILGSGAGITYLVESGTLVGLSANASNAVRVNFYSVPADTDAPPTLLGTDTNLRDGGSLSWWVPQSGIRRLYMWAEAIGVTGTTVSTDTITVMWDEPTNGASIGDLQITPSTYRQDGMVEVISDTVVTLSVSASEVLSVSFYWAPPGTGVTPNLIGTDTNLTNGASIQWQVPEPMGHMHMWAEGNLAIGGQITGQIITVLPVEICEYDWFFTFDASTPTECPTAVGTVNAMAQDFEGGRVFWYPIPATDNQNYFFVVYNSGNYDYYVDDWPGESVTNSEFAAPEGLYVPIDRIGWLWATNETVRRNLGYAYSPVEEFTGRYQNTILGNQNQTFPPQFPGWLLYIDYGKQGLVLQLSEVSAGNGGRTWSVVGSY